MFWEEQLELIICTCFLLIFLPCLASYFSGTPWGLTLLTESLPIIAGEIAVLLMLASYWIAKEQQLKAPTAVVYSHCYSGRPLEKLKPCDGKNIEKRALYEHE